MYKEVPSMILTPKKKVFVKQRLVRSTGRVPPLEHVVCEQVVVSYPIDGENALCLADVEWSIEDLAADASPVAPPSTLHSKPTTIPVTPPTISNPSPLQTQQDCLSANRAISLRRGAQRWSTLLSARTSRVARVMLPVLGEEEWDSFVDYATARNRAAFLAAFDPPSHTLHCVGTCNGEACRSGFVVDLSSPSSTSKLKHLHLDHEQDLQVTLDMWKNALPLSSLSSWHDGVDKDLLCHLLFGVAEDPAFGPPMLRFRCGPSHLGSGEGYCHQLNMPHYRSLRHVASGRQEAEP